MISPELSVVMSNYNGANELEQTIQSVLDQKEADFEFIIIDDGSVDDSSKIIESAKRSDSRIKMLSQENLGLTQALITGCSMAKGRFIARQDVGDISLPGRFSHQLTELRSDAQLAMVSSSVIFTAPDGEELGVESLTQEQALVGLKQTNMDDVKGPPHHGSVMFRRSMYAQVGGYRSAFYYAQDIDLWTRLVELGNHMSLHEPLYRASINREAISSLNRPEQISATEFIFKCIKARASLGDDSDVLAEFERNRKTRLEPTRPDRYSDSKFYYYLGSRLGKINRQSSGKYLIKSMRSNPFNLKALIKLFLLKLHD